jgi:hypothetical protein
MKGVGIFLPDIRYPEIKKQKFRASLPCVKVFFGRPSKRQGNMDTGAAERRWCVGEPAHAGAKQNQCGGGFAGPVLGKSIFL